MTRRPDQVGDAHFAVPEEYEELAERVTQYFAGQSLDPAVRARQLHHLRELAAAQPLPSAARGHVGPRWRGLGRRVAGTAAASLAAVTLSTSAVAAASLNALPGDTLYPTKRLVERVQLAAALTPEGDVAVLMDQAQRRAHEAVALQERGADPELVDETLLALQQQLQQAQAVTIGDQELQQQLAVAAVAVVEQLQVLAMPESEDESGAYKAAMQAAEASTTPESTTTDEPPEGSSAGESAGTSEPEPADATVADPAPDTGSASAADPTEGGPSGPVETEAEPADGDPGPEPGQEPPEDPPIEDPTDDESPPSDYQSTPPLEETPTEDPSDPGQIPASYNGVSETGTATAPPPVIEIPAHPY